MFLTGFLCIDCLHIKTRHHFAVPGFETSNEVRVTSSSKVLWMMAVQSAMVGLVEDDDMLDSDDEVACEENAPEELPDDKDVPETD